VNTVMNFRVPYNVGYSRVAAELAVSQEGLRSMALVSYWFNDSVSAAGISPVKCQ
jgi:hypothetical protein